MKVKNDLNIVIIFNSGGKLVIKSHMIIIVFFLIFVSFILMIDILIFHCFLSRLTIKVSAFSCYYKVYRAVIFQSAYTYVYD